MRKAETYFTVETKDGKGLCFITECGNQMYHTGNNPMRYHGVLCPKCFWKNKKVTLYLEGTDEANKYCNAHDESVGQKMVEPQESEVQDADSD